MAYTRKQMTKKHHLMGRRVWGKLSRWFLQNIKYYLSKYSHFVRLCVLRSTSSLHLVKITQIKGIVFLFFTFKSKKWHHTLFNEIFLSKNKAKIRYCIFWYFSCSTKMTLWQLFPTINWHMELAQKSLWYCIINNLVCCNTTNMYSSLEH